MKSLLFALPLLVPLLSPAVEMATVSSTACCPDNFATLGGRCIYIATDVYFGSSPARNWTWSRDLCTSMFGEGDLWKTDLAIVDVPLMAAFSSHVVQNLSGMKGYIYWVGSEKVNGQWKWIDGTPISNTSYVWHISSPASTLSDGVNGILIPSGAFDRFYMYESESPSRGPSYLCEAKKK
ncbi:C-type lectin domain family 6 member A-like [Macrobrachium rosenbergii]|uniref:C-type lectin domain family 6 member A-like n=1 Tax=Macrobrachium rosenbergii TaxID=79674 RepID=UPI0034D7AEF8